MNPALMLLVLLVSAAAAESIRETETMDRRGFYDDFSGDFEDDDEDVNESTDYTTSPDYNEADDDSSGSGDSDEYDPTFDMETTVTLGNKIPEDDIARKRPEDFDTNDNEIVPINLVPKDLEPSNEISMASTGNAGFFSRKEVVVALVAGTVVGLVFAVLIIVLLVMRLQKKDVNNCDSVKKPIYKKAPTIEV